MEYLRGPPEVDAGTTSLPVLRARHSVALRGAEGVSVVDYADGSLTQAPHPSRHGVRVFSLAKELGQPSTDQREAIADHRAFIDAACANFGVDSLRQLPDASARVVQWVEARRAAGDETAPAPEAARRWVQFCETETLRSLAAAKALRSVSASVKQLEDEQKRRSTRRRRDMLDLVLVDLASVYRDALVVQTGAGLPLVNPDFEGLAREIAGRVPAAGLVECLEAISQCRERLGQSVTPAVAFNGMLGRIRLACNAS